jgi:protein gp37
MGSKTSIEWTRGDDGSAGSSWNPIRAGDLGPVGTGPGVGFHCEIVSPGCERCYAAAINKRLGTRRPYLARERTNVSIYLDEKTLTQPLRWKKPRKVFVGSMTDLFGDWVTDEMLDLIFAVMALCAQHTFQCLTKRPERMRDYLVSDRRAQIYDTAERISEERYGHRSIGTGEWPLPNCWMGTSVEDQRRADERIPLLLQTPAALRWISAEPLLGETRISHYLTDRGDSDATWIPPLDWVVIGGESGPGARPFNVEWASSVVRQCEAAGVPVFVKQIGARAISGHPGSPPLPWITHDRKGGVMEEWPEDLRVREYPAS